MSIGTAFPTHLFPDFLEICEEEDQLRTSLRYWQVEPNATWNKEEAAKRILHAYHTGSAMLNLCGLQLQTLPKSLHYLSRLKTLDLSCNSLKNAQDLSHLTDLETLNLNNNQITRVSDLSPLIKLRTLSLDENHLQSLEGLDRLTALKSLALSNNKLQRIDGLERLTGLEELDLGVNNLNCVEGLRLLNALTRLDVSRNNLTNVQSIGSLPNLRYLSIASNVDLQELPIGLRNANLSIILYDQTKVPEGNVRDILTACEAKRSARLRGC